MKRNFRLVAILLLCLPLLAQAQTSDVKSEENLVKQTVESYLSKTSQTALHPDAKIISVDGTGKRLIESSFKPDKLRKGETSGESLQSIVSVNVTEGGASVAVETDFIANKITPTMPSKHIQYISLLKLNGEWKIVSILMPPLKFAEIVSK